MKFTKSLSLVIAVLSLAVGSADCVNAQSYRVSFSDANHAPSKSDQIETVDADDDYAAIQPPVHFAKNVTATSLKGQLAGVRLSPSIDQTSFRTAPTPALITLGAGDDLRQSLKTQRELC